MTKAIIAERIVGTVETAELGVKVNVCEVSAVEEDSAGAPVEDDSETPFWGVPVDEETGAGAGQRVRKPTSSTSGISAGDCASEYAVKEA